MGYPPKLSTERFFASMKVRSFFLSRRFLTHKALLGAFAWLIVMASLHIVPALAQAKPQAQKDQSADKIVEAALPFYGGRKAIFEVQKNGIIKNNLKLGIGENAREGRSTLKFIRKPKVMEDLVLLELDLPDTKFTMGFDGQKTWAMNEGQRTDISPELSEAFRSSYAHGYEALLRYKEDGSKIEYVETKKAGSLEIDVIDLTATDGTKTRYEVSRKSGHILYLEYESKPATPDAKPNKYRLHFKDFKLVQNAVVIPYKTVVFENGVQVEERTVVEAAFGAQMDEKIFMPDAPATAAEKKEETPTKP